MTQPLRPSIHAVLALSLLGLAPAADAAPRGSDEWLICETGGATIELGTGENGCCTDEDQDGYVDTCWVCDANHENCRSEELGEDLSATQAGSGGRAPIGGGSTGPSWSTPATGLPQMQLHIDD